GALLPAGDIDRAPSCASLEPTKQSELQRGHARYVRLGSFCLSRPGDRINARFYDPRNEYGPLFTRPLRASLRADHMPSIERTDRQVPRGVTRLKQEIPTC